MSGYYDDGQLDLRSPATQAREEHEAYTARIRATLEDGREDAVRRGVHGYSTEELEAELRKRKMSAVQAQLTRREEIRAELQAMKIHARALKDELEGIKITTAQCPDHKPVTERVSGFGMACPTCENE